MAQFFSIGHSNRSVAEFVGMLTAARVELLADVRSFPMSQSNPVFNIDRLPAELAPAGIEYRHLRALGGRRKKQPGVDDSVNAMWRVQSFHNYADYALGEEFAAAFCELVQLGRERILPAHPQKGAHGPGTHGRVAVMCSEAVWWRCHRRIIVDYLLARGHAVDHLMGPGQTTHATMTPGAKVTAEGKVVYPAE